ncbi:MAG: glycosyltransferase family 9 protein [Actinomycetota bacterium]|nr:glycosyltransferase family 9 protein [Actinomycetota bacterium]
MSNGGSNAPQGRGLPAPPPVGTRGMKGEPLDGVRRIAVLHSRGIGDFVFALPALHALRAAYPAAEMVLLGAPWYVEFLAGRPVPVHRVVPVQTSAVTGPDDLASGSLDAFFAEQAAERYDLAVQLQGGGRYSNPFLLRLGARHTVGARTRDAAPLERWIPYFHYQNEVMRCLEVAGLVGAPPVQLEPSLAPTAADLEESRQIVPEGPDPVVALHPGASDTRRRWPPERFASVADALVAAGARVVVTGTEPERETVRQVLATTREEASDACGRLSVSGLLGLLSRCRLVVSNDTGPLHLAEAVGAATVGLFWCGNLINAGPFGRRRHRPLISWQLDCPVCGTDCTAADCPHRPSFLLRIHVDEAREQALDLFGDDSHT